jgi:methionyl-tRNA formyltransferase
MDRKRKKIVFMGGKEIGYHCMEHLLENKNALGAEVVGILASGRMLFEKDLGIEELCKKHAVPFISSLEDYLTLENFDILISVQYHQILKKKHIEKAKQIAVNLHMAPLPEYRGCNQFSFAIIDGAKEFGTTIHQLEPSIDGGAIMFEKRFPVPHECFVKDLYMKTYEASLDLFKERIRDIIEGNYEPTPQSQYENARSTSYHTRDELEGIKNIDMSWDEEKKRRYFRGTYFPPFDPPYMVIEGKKKNLTLEWYNAL